MKLSPRNFIEKNNLTILAGLFVFASYWFMWGSLENFVNAVDHCDRLFCDFTAHYYPMGKAIFAEKEPISGFFYSAFSAILFSVFSLVRVSTAGMIWGVIQIAATYLLLILPLKNILKLSAKNRALFVLLFLTSLPVLHNFKWGQVSVLITFLIIAAFISYQQGKSILASVLLALATSIKYYPVIFIIIFIIKQDYRFLRDFFLTVVVFTLLTAGLLGPASWMRFDLYVIDFTMNKVWTSFNSQYIVSVIDRLSIIFLDTKITDARLVLLERLSLMVLAVNAGLAWHMLRNNKGVHRFYIAVMTIFLSIPFFIKTSWPHYFTFFPFCQSLFFIYAQEEIYDRRIRYPVLALISLSVVLANVYFFKLFPDWKTYSELGPFFFSNVLLLLTVYIFNGHLLMKNKNVSPP